MSDKEVPTPGNQPTTHPDLDDAVATEGVQSSSGSASSAPEAPANASMKDPLGWNRSGVCQAQGRSCPSSQALTTLRSSRAMRWSETTCSPIRVKAPAPAMIPSKPRSQTHG